VWYSLQKLKVVKQAPETYGSFYSGDSYIVLVVSIAVLSAEAGQAADEEAADKDVCGCRQWNGLPGG